MKFKMQETELFYDKPFLRYQRNNGKKNFQFVAEI